MVNDEATVIPQPTLRPLSGMARWTGIAVLATALVTVAATGIALWSFHDFERTLATVDHQVVPSLTTALALSEEVAGLAGAAGELAGADTPAELAERRARQHAAAGQALATLDALKPAVSPDQWREVAAALAALLRSLNGLAEVVEQQVRLSEQHRRLDQEIAHSITRFSEAANVLVFQTRALARRGVAAAHGPGDIGPEEAQSLKGEGSLYFIQLKAALDLNDPARLLDSELMLRQTVVSLRNLAAHLESGALAARDPEAVRRLDPFFSASQTLAFGQDGVFALRQAELALADKLADAVALSRRNAGALQTVVRQAVGMVEGEVARQRRELVDQLQVSRAQLVGLSLGGLALALAIALAITRAVARHERDFLRAVEAADSANHAKSEFLANMSHELRTPLNAIIGFAEILKQEVFGPLGSPRYREYAGLIEAAGDNLLKILSDILDLSRIEAGHFDLYPEAVSAAEAVEAAVRIVEVRARRDGVKVGSTLAPDLPPVFADPTRLKQILVNLLSNATKFTNSGGSAHVTVGLLCVPHADQPGGSREMLCFIVRDNGIGMSWAAIAKALQPFVQVDTEMNRQHGGTGLGLPLVARLVNLSGGTLAIDSVEGRGTEVIVTLPAAVRAGVDEPVSVTG